MTKTPEKSRKNWVRFQCLWRGPGRARWRWRRGGPPWKAGIRKIWI